MRAAIALSRRLSVFLCVLLAGLWAVSHAASAETYQLTYKITHSKYGNIGTYSNTIDTNGPNTTVTTQSNIVVKVLGIVAHRQSSQRVERWNGDRLVYFHSVSSVNGKQTTVDGTSQGDHFAVTTPSGMTMAPALIRVANPWSPKLMTGDTILAPDEGTVEKVQMAPAQDTMVSINGQDVAAKLYDIGFMGIKKHCQVWFDSSGIPVKFTQTDSDGTVTFTLTIQKPGNDLVAQKQSSASAPLSR